MARVFILEDVRDKKRIAIDEAGDFGTVTFIFDGKEKRPPIFSEAFKREISKKFQEARFNPTEDFFCIAGYFVPVIIATVELVLDYEEIKVLYFSATDQHYLPRRLGEKGGDSREIERTCEESNTISSRNVR